MLPVSVYPPLSRVPSQQSWGVFFAVKTGGQGWEGELGGTSSGSFDASYGQYHPVLVQEPVAANFGVLRSDRWEKGAEFRGRSSPSSPTPDRQVVSVVSWP